MILFIGQVASDQRDREAFQEVDYRQMFGPGTLGFAKWVGEMHDADRLPEYVGARLPRRDAGAARPGRARAARGHAARRRPAAPVLPRVEPALAAPAPGALASAARAARRRRAAVRHRRRQRLGRAAACAALERFAERWQLPVGCAFRFQDVFDNRHPNYAGDVGIGINPKLAARIARRRPDRSRSAPRLGEMTTGGYDAARAAAAAPAARPHPRRRRGARPRLCAPTCSINASMACAAPALADARRRRRRSAGRAWTAAAHADYEANLVADAGRAARHGRGRRRRSSAIVPRRHDLHQRRRQLQPAGCIASIATPACATPAARSSRRLGCDGLRRAGGRRRGAARSRSAPSSTSPATATS